MLSKLSLAFNKYGLRHLANDCIIIELTSERKKKENIKINFQSFKKNDSLEFSDEKIIKEKDGELISQIIIGNILKNSDNINENLEIKLSRNYQVLSKKTSLFAVVEGEQENKIAEFKQIKKREKPQNISHINNIYNEYNVIMYAPKKKKKIGKLPNG